MVKIAICVRGSIRTWDLCKHNIFGVFNFAKHKNVSVDWFFDSWDTDTYTRKIITEDGKLISAEQVLNPVTPEVIAGIQNDFISHRQNLIKITAHKFDKDLLQCDSFLKLIYLSNCSKRFHELSNNMRYDVVLQIRPDTIFDSSCDIFPQVIIDSAKFNAINHAKRSYDEFGNFKGYCVMPPAPTNPFTPVESVSPVCDFVFYGPSWLIDYLSSCYIAISEAPYVKRYFPHASLYLHLQKANIVVANETETVHVVRNVDVAGVNTYKYFLDHPEEVKSMSKDLIRWIDLSNGAWYKTQ